MVSSSAAHRPATYCGRRTQIARTDWPRLASGGGGHWLAWRAATLTWGTTMGPPDVRLVLACGLAGNTWQPAADSGLTAPPLDRASSLAAASSAKTGASAPTARLPAKQRTGEADPVSRSGSARCTPARDRRSPGCRLLSRRRHPPCRSRAGRVSEPSPPLRQLVLGVARQVIAAAAADGVSVPAPMSSVARRVLRLLGG